MRESQKINVAHVVFSFNLGGIENLLVDVLNNSTEHEKLFLVIINDSVNEKLLSSIKKRSGVNVYCMKRPVGGRKIEYILRLARIIKEEKIDVLHFHNSNVFEMCLALKAFKPVIRMYLTIHATNTYVHFNYVDVALHKLFINRISAISNSVAKEVLERGFPKERLKVIYNGVDDSKFYKAEFDGHKDCKKIICVARLQPEVKGQDILLKALAILRESGLKFECEIVGGAPNNHPEYLEYIEGMIDDLHLRGCVSLLGARNDIPSLLAGADYFVLPSRNEGFGIALIEAMLSKVLVIATENDGPKEIVKNNEYGYLFPVDDYKMLAEILKKVYESDNSELVDRAYRYALNNYSIQAMINAFDEMYYQK